jgi:murein DD-endopeptidase MepM/ murein hydrolase activator NlpD
LKTGLPVVGETVHDYAMESLSYNETTRDWRVHNGIDIAAEAGTTVCAAADGTVYTTYEDDTMGYTVVIRHQDGYVTVYSSLSEDLAVSAGDAVTLGQAIGTVSNSALLESAIGDHLHFSVSCNDEPVDPNQFLGLN